MAGAFDPIALRAMLEAFYQPPSPRLLGVARAERPDYFGGGELFGSKGDKLRLPDGRVFDCLIGAGGPPSKMRWGVFEVTDTGGGDGDPFALEEGPLAFVDERMPIFAGDGSSFAELVAGHLAGFGASAEQLDNARSQIQEGDGSGALEDSYSRNIEPAGRANDETRRALDADDFIDERQAADDHTATIDDKEPTDIEDEPPDIPEPNPGPLPI